MTKIRVLRVDMRAQDPKVIQDDLQGQVDMIMGDGLSIVGEVRPLPSPNSALQYFIVTCAEGKNIDKAPVKKEEEAKSNEEPNVVKKSNTPFENPEKKEEKKE